MGGTCHRCGTAVDPLRSPARIVGTRVVPFCRTCAASTPATLSHTAVTAVEPSSDADSGEASGEFIVAPRPVAPASRAWTRPALTTASIAGVLLLGYALIKPSQGATSTPTPLLTDSVNTPLSAPAPVPEPAEPELETEPEHTVLVPDPSVPAPVSSDPAAPRFPATFIHPLPGRERLLPTNGTRRFGAERPGNRPSECLAGHCGVDLAGPVGTPVLSVRDGVVQRVVRSADGSGGRFVAVDHGDMITYYFHLDEIRADLVVGLHVAAGEPVGTLGHTGILHAPAHLHFALRRTDLAGDGGRGRYVDPVPYLERSTVLSSPGPASPGPAPADSTRTRDEAPAPSIP